MTDSPQDLAKGYNETMDIIDKMMNDLFELREMAQEILSELTDTLPTSCQIRYADNRVEVITP